MDALHRNQENLEYILQRADYVRRLRRAGHRYCDIVATEERPLIVEILTENMYRLVDAGSSWRKAEAQALRAEGLSTQQIANLFGVTRQRVGQLLQPTRARGRGPTPGPPGGGSPTTVGQPDATAVAVPRPRRRPKVTPVRQ